MFLSFLKIRTHAKRRQSTQYPLQKICVEMYNILEDICKLQEYKNHASFILHYNPSTVSPPGKQATLNNYLFIE